MSKSLIISDVAGDSDEEIAQVPPARKSRSKAASQQQSVVGWTNAPVQPQVHQYTLLCVWSDEFHEDAERTAKCKIILRRLKMTCSKTNVARKIQW